MADLIISLSDFIIKNQSNKTVGMLCKRIELAIEEAKKDNRDYLTLKEVEAMKNQIKEVIYEQYRNLKDIVDTSKVILSNQKTGEK
jgi:predicted transcriptional regulator YheO